MFLVPLGHEHFSVRRLPWLTLAIALLCVVVQVVSSVHDPAVEADMERVARELASLATEHAAVERETQPSLTRGFGPLSVPVEESESVRDARQARARAELAQIEARIASARAEYTALSRRLVTMQLGYRPNHDGPLAMLTCAFTHGGVLHLLGNLLFLYLVGLNMEDRWGTLRLAALYVGGIFASALAFKLGHPRGDDVLVGASGAIAALMGAFSVSYARTRIRFAYFYWIFLKPRWGTFWAPAWLCLPLWFLQEALMTLVERRGGADVAHSAHVGGFALGCVVAAIMRMRGVDERLREESEHSTDPRDQWSRDPELADAEGIIQDGRPADALARIEQVLAQKPEHEDALALACAAALALRDEAKLERHETARLTLLARKGELMAVAERYRLLRETFPGHVFGEPLLRAVLTSARGRGADPKVALDVAGQLLRHHPTSELVPRALWLAADAQEALGDKEKARTTLSRLCESHPYDPLAEKARLRLQTASLPPHQ